MHLLHKLQCLLLGVLITKHSGHKQLASNCSNNSIKSNDGSDTSLPGSLQQQIIDRSIDIMKRPIVMFLEPKVSLERCGKTNATNIKKVSIIRE